MNWTENKWLKPAWMGEGNDFVTKYQDKFAQIGDKFAPKIAQSKSKVDSLGYEKEIDKRGIFLTHSTEELSKELLERIQSFVPEVKLKLLLNNEAHRIYAENAFKIHSKRYIGLALEIIFSNAVNFHHDPSLDNYDEFQGYKSQAVNVHQYLETTQDAFFLYAFTHAAIEYLNSVKLKTNRYLAAHNPTLRHDLQLFDDIARKSVEGNPNYNWNWWNNLNNKKIIDSKTQFLDNGATVSSIHIKDSSKKDDLGLKLIEIYVNDLGGTKRFDKFVFYNVNTDTTDHEIIL